MIWVDTAEDCFADFLRMKKISLYKLASRVVIHRERHLASPCFVDISCLHCKTTWLWRARGHSNDNTKVSFQSIDLPHFFHAREWGKIIHSAMPWSSAFRRLHFAPPVDYTAYFMAWMGNPYPNPLAAAASSKKSGRKSAAVALARPQFGNASIRTN